MVDITSMIVSLGTSIAPLERMISGFSYLLGFMLIWAAIKKMKAIADARARYGGQGKMFIPLMYFVGGAALFFLPTAVNIAGNTLFGSDSPIAYASWVQQLKEKYGDSTYVMTQFMTLAGVLWFIRGTLLLVQASEPGVQHGPKGMAFMVAGIVAINIQTTVDAIASVMNYISSITI